MLPTDPKEASKLGQAWGETLTDSVFGIVDIFKNRKAMKAANDAKVLNKNAITDINNQIVRNNNALRVQAMKEIAHEQERAMLAKLTPAQREAFYKQKAEAAKAAAKAAREAEIAHEEMVEMVWISVVIFVFLPLMVWFGLLVWGVADPMAYYSLKDWVPLLKTIVGR